MILLYFLTKSKESKEQQSETYQSNSRRFDKDKKRILFEVPLGHNFGRNESFFVLMTAGTEIFPKVFTVTKPLRQT